MTFNIDKALNFARSVHCFWMDDRDKQAPLVDPPKDQREIDELLENNPYHNRGDV